MIVTLEEIKNYLRVDSAQDDALLSSLMLSATRLCTHILRVNHLDELSQYQDELRVAILYATAYLYEHREEANHRELTLTLRSLLFGIRKAEF
ncbi:phage gp6-like head-tail connector protein [Aerococcaceae bacterium zg-1292]|nr:phage gp6-like head-tail connector protein [Aerococcaceae bacterium zg-1292]